MFVLSCCCPPGQALDHAPTHCLHTLETVGGAGMAGRRHSGAAAGGGGGAGESLPLLGGGGSSTSPYAGGNGKRGAYGSGEQHKALTDDPPDLGTFHQASSMYHLPSSRRRSSWVFLVRVSG